MSDFKNSDAPINTTTIDKNLIDASTGNIYEAISIISKRAIQINGHQKGIDREIRRICHLQ